MALLAKAASTHAAEQEPSVETPARTINLANFPRQLMEESAAPLTLDPTRLLLVFKQPLDRQTVETLLRRTEFVLEDSPYATCKDEGLSSGTINHTDQRYWVRARCGTDISQELMNGLQMIVRSKLEWVGPVYRVRDMKDRKSLFCPIPNVLLIKVRPAFQAQDAVVTRTLSTFQLEEARNLSKYLVGYRYCVLKQGGEETVYRIRQDLLLKATDLVEKVEFDFMPLLAPLGSCALPVDPLYRDGSQWNMDQIHAGGPPGSCGWDLSKGSPTVVVGVIDYGCDLTHCDLIHNYYTLPGAAQSGATFDFSSGNTGAPPSIGGDAPQNQPHGTCCAGIAAATQNTIGVAGLAGLCGIMPLRPKNWTRSEVAACIKYAADNGVRVISMSFGWDPTTVPTDYFSVMDNSITYASKTKKVVMCAASMNDGKDWVYYPAANQAVIACGASNKCDRRCTSADWPNTSFSGSNYGPGLSVVAPGVQIPTTTNLSGYVTTFLGTSAATPHVAGLAALLISLNPILASSPQQVRTIIESTADKVPDPLLYVTQKPNGTWYDEMGYGRINVFKALSSAGMTGDVTSPPPPTNLQIK
jgi:subtilisin family serine protease